MRRMDGSEVSAIHVDTSSRILAAVSDLDTFTSDWGLPAVDPAEHSRWARLRPDPMDELPPQHWTNEPFDDSDTLSESESDGGDETIIDDDRTLTAIPLPAARPRHLETRRLASRQPLSTVRRKSNIRVTHRSVQPTRAPSPEQDATPQLHGRRSSPQRSSGLRSSARRTLNLGGGGARPSPQRTVRFEEPPSSLLLEQSSSSSFDLSSRRSSQYSRQSPTELAPEIDYTRADGGAGGDSSRWHSTERPRRRSLPRAEVAPPGSGASVGAAKPRWRLLPWQEVPTLPEASDEDRSAPTSADDARVLPAPWEERVSRSTGDVYYFNSKTGESTYDRPGGPLGSGGQEPEGRAQHASKTAAVLSAMAAPERDPTAAGGQAAAAGSVGATRRKGAPAAAASAVGRWCGCGGRPHASEGWGAPDPAAPLRAGAAGRGGGGGVAWRAASPVRQVRLPAETVRITPAGEEKTIAGPAYMPMSRVVSELLAEWHAEARDNDAEVYERARAASDAKRKLRREEEGREKEEKEEEQGVPEGWEEKTSRSSGDKYWVHLTTGRYSWERPVDSSSERDSDGTEGKEEEEEGAVPFLWHEAALAPDECVWDSEVDSEVPEILALEQKTAKARAANLQKREREAAAAAAAAATVLTTGGSKTDAGAAAEPTGAGSAEAHAKPATSGSSNGASGGGIAVGGLIRRKRQLTMDKRFGALSDTNHHRFWLFLNRPQLLYTHGSRA